VVLPPTPTQVFIPPKTTKPLPVKKPKPKVERKEPIAKPDPPAEQRNESTETATAEPPAAPPVAGSHADSRSGHSEAHYTPANSNANYLRNPAPVYPNVARQRHWEGLVLLRVFVTEHGHCGEIGVQRSSGHDVLDESAMIAVRKWMFIPAKRGETTVSSWVTVPIEFRLE
jgi:protein TonB